MAQTVEYTLKLNIDGQDHVVNLSSDVKRLAEDLSVSKEGSDELRKSLLKINNITQSFQNAAQGIQELTGTLLDLTDTYATQQINETRLANNMRNTMGAREEEIQSIKDLCSAQQELGVIGDEVQLAGAQELATYLEKKSSLEALIPVMNDMLAQQYGLEASEESAAQVASMLGKVMEGQTAALSRYGYSFDEAQEQILKFGTEEERAAVLAEVVESSVGGMNEALRQTPAGQAKAAADRLGDMKENIGAMIAPLQSIILSVGTFASAINTVATTATGIYGVVQALQTLDVRQKAAAISSRALAIHQRVQATAQRLLAAAGYSAAAGTTALTVATTALYAALTLGISALITAIVTAISRLTGETEKYVDTADDAQEITRSFSDTAAQASSKLQFEIAQLKNLKDGTAEAASKVNELNASYGTAFGYHKTAAEWYDTLVQKSQAYCQQLGYEAQAKVIAAQKAEKELELQANGQKMNQLMADGKTTISPEYLALVRANEKLISQTVDLDRQFKTCMQKAREASEAMGAPVVRTTTTTQATTKKPEEETYEKGTLGDIEQQIQKLQQARKHAHEENIAQINDEIAHLEDLKRAMDEATNEASVTAAKTDWTTVPLDQIRTYRQLENVIQALNEKLINTDADARNAIQRQISEANHLKNEWDEVLDKIDQEINPKIKPEIDTKEVESGMERFKKAWSGIKGISSGIESITQALNDNSNAWQKTTALIDAFLQIADGISAVVKITETLAMATRQQSAAKKQETQSTAENTAGTITNIAAKQAETGAAIAANKAAAASYLELAAAEYMAAHAYIPFAGYGIGAGFAAAAKALVEGMGMMAFAGGGIVGGSSTTGDRLIARVNSGEMILNQHQQLLLWQLLNGQRSSLSASSIQYSPPQVGLDVPALQSQLRPYNERVHVTGTLRGRGRDLVATIDTEQNHRSRS